MKCSFQTFSVLNWSLWSSFSSSLSCWSPLAQWVSIIFAVLICNLIHYPSKFCNMHIWIISEQIPFLTTLQCNFCCTVLHCHPLSEFCNRQYCTYLNNIWTGPVLDYAATGRFLFDLAVKRNRLPFFAKQNAFSCKKSCQKLSTEK